MRRVLDYPQVHAFEHWTGTEKEQYIIKVRSSSIVIDEWQPVHISADPDDDKFFSCAVAAGAAYIVSKDKHILDIGEYQHIKTVKPGYFVERVLKVAA